MLLQRQDDAVGDDGEEDGVLERGPLNQELGRPPDDVPLAEYEERGGPRPGQLGPAPPAHMATHEERGRGALRAANHLVVLLTGLLEAGATCLLGCSKPGTRKGEIKKFSNS